MPTAADAIAREHVEAFIAVEIERTSATSAGVRYRSLQQLFKWLEEEGEVAVSSMARMRPPKTPEKLVPVLPEEDARRRRAMQYRKISQQTRTATRELGMDLGPTRRVFRN